MKTLICQLLFCLPVTVHNKLESTLHTSLVSCPLEKTEMYILLGKRNWSNQSNGTDNPNIYLLLVYNNVIFRKPPFKDRSEMKHFLARHHILLCERESKKGRDKG